jgi:hypothetical protein
VRVRVRAANKGPRALSLSRTNVGPALVAVPWFANGTVRRPAATLHSNAEKNLAMWWTGAKKKDRRFISRRSRRG